MAVIVKRNSVIVVIGFRIVRHYGSDDEGADKDDSGQSEAHHQMPGMS